MSSLALRAYHLLPSFGREHWNSSQWRTWQENGLAAVLHRAARHVPHYRKMCSDWRNLRAWEHLKNWPILKKEALRANPNSFLAEECNPQDMWCEHTSGTTGTPLTLWQSRETLQH